MNKEIWKDIAGYNGHYQISDSGKVRSFKGSAPIELASYKTSVGYPVVTLCDGKNKHRVLVHRLVGAAFIPNPLNLPQLNHMDLNKANNSARNLEWSTAKDNMRHLRASNTGKNRLSFSAARLIKLRRNLCSIDDLSKEFGVAPRSIRFVLNGKTWGHV